MTSCQFTVQDTLGKSMVLHTADVALYSFVSLRALAEILLHRDCRVRIVMLHVKLTFLMFEYLNYYAAVL